jgi:hypothetical protein
MVLSSSLSCARIDWRHFLTWFVHCNGSRCCPLVCHCASLSLHQAKEQTHTWHSKDSPHHHVARVRLHLLNQHRRSSPGLSSGMLGLAATLSTHKDSPAPLATICAQSNSPETQTSFPFFFESRYTNQWRFLRNT